ncbi:MAG: HDOD domain-containing protein [Acidimicrobiales bacterium]
MSDGMVDGVELEEVMGVPVASVVAVQVLQRLDGEVTSAAEVGRMMDLDLALSTRAVFLANSSFYGLRERVASSARAVPILGLTVVRTLVAGAAFGLFERADGDQVDDFWPHAVGTAAAASVIAERVGVDREHAFSLGLLHDMGAILQARRDPTAWRDLAQTTLGHDALEWERERFGCDHPDLGARALAVARLPEDVVAAVAAHHDVEPAAPRTLASVLVAAESVVGRLGQGRAQEPSRPLEAALRAVGIAERLADDLCLRVERRVEGLADLIALGR